jgi:long-subunit fatty acid transport protein
MRVSLRRHASAATTVLSVLCASSLAHATGITEFPDNGSEQSGRGGAWIARASDPLAAFYNPAGLAGQPTRLILQSNINFQKTCMDRLKAPNDTTSEASGTVPGQYFGRVCSNDGAGVDPQLAMTFHVTDRIGIGFAPLLAPSAGASKISFPQFVSGTSTLNGKQTAYTNEPGPTRYMLTNANLLVLNPTLGIGVEVVKRLRLGVSFQWGIASLQFSNAAAVGANTESVDNSQDTKTNASAHDYFIPGVTAGVIYSPTDSFDIAAWFKASASINATGDVQTTFPYSATAPGSTQMVSYGDTSKTNCGIPANTTITGKPVTACGGGNNLNINVAQPTEAKVGFRYHKLRSDVPYDEHVRDPMAQDVFDVEVDLTFANDSSFQNLQVTLPGDAATGAGTIPINGLQRIANGNAPANDNVPHGYKNVYGVRLGGDVNVLPDQLAIRAGGFIQSNGQNPQYQDVDFMGSMNGGLAIGTTYRVHVSKEKQSALEISVGYEHVFYANENYTGPDGVYAIAGTACGNGQNFVGLKCSGGGQTYRSPWAINLGTITQSIDVLNVGLGYKF